MTVLQWGPVVVTGIRYGPQTNEVARKFASMGSGRGDRNQVPTGRAVVTAAASLQWGPVVVTGISSREVRSLTH